MDADHTALPDCMRTGDQRAGEAGNAPPAAPAKVLIHIDLHQCTIPAGNPEGNGPDVKAAGSC